MFRGFNNWIYPLLYRRFGYPSSKAPEYGARALGGTCINHGHIQHLRMQDEQLSEDILWSVGSGGCDAHTFLYTSTT